MATKHSKPLLELRIDGPRIHAGRISVPDLVQICDKAQSAVLRQAEAMAGERTLRPGPVTADVKEECTLELVGISRGSAVLSFDLAKPQLSITPTLAVDVVSEVGRTIGDLYEDTDRNYDPGVLDSLRGLGEVIDRGTICSIQWIVPRRVGQKKRLSAIYNQGVLERVTRRLRLPEKQPMTVEGTLEMADFKQDDEKCRIHPPVGNPVSCGFAKDMEDDVYALLRRTVRARGEASIDPYSRRVSFIQVKSIEPLDPLAMGAAAFRAAHSFEELARLQGVKPLDDIDILAGGFPEDEDIDGFLNEIYEHREKA